MTSERIPPRVSRRMSNGASIRYVEHRRAMRRWLLLRPHVIVWRVLAWLRWKRVPPWRLTLTMLAVVDPRPLAPKQLAALRKFLRDTGGE